MLVESFQVIHLVNAEKTNIIFWSVMCFDSWFVEIQWKNALSNDNNAT